MKPTPKRSIFAAVLVCGALAAGPGLAAATAQEAVFLVRHAERQDQSTDSPLSVEGRARAARLAQMLRDARITSIYVTEFLRTAQTAEPLAALLKLPLVTMPAADSGALVAKLRVLDPHARVLVVSHSDRLPALLNALGASEPIDIPAGEYDDLFVVIQGGRPGASIVMRLRY